MTESTVRRYIAKPKLKIGLRLLSINSLDVQKPGNVQGDEQVGRSWQKYLTKCEEVESVHLYGRHGPITDNIDVLIHFNPYLDIEPNTKNILYLQNAFPKEHFPGGTVGVFNQVRTNFDGYIFTSQKLMEACKPGAFVPFATDPEFFFPQASESYNHPVCFVGNDIRGPVINFRYFLPALKFGLVIYGNGWSAPLADACCGKLPMPELPKVYSSVQINLNAHIREHGNWDTINMRVYDCLACGGFVLSDELDSLSAIFGDAVVCTKGDEDGWAKLVRYLGDAQEREKRSREGRKMVLSNHTYTQRMRTVIRYLKEIV
jgi:spore maturation protein CgeB